jgi:hypothetical protein
VTRWRICVPIPRKTAPGTRPHQGRFGLWGRRYDTPSHKSAQRPPTMQVMARPGPGEALRITDAAAASPPPTITTPSVRATARIGRCTDREGWPQMSAVATTTVLVSVYDTQSIRTPPTMTRIHRLRCASTAACSTVDNVNPRIPETFLSASLSSTVNPRSPTVNSVAGRVHRKVRKASAAAMSEPPASTSRSHVRNARSTWWYRSREDSTRSRVA